MDKRKYNRSIIPEDMKFLTQHGRMFANFGGEYVLKAFSNNVALTNGNVGEAWLLGHIVWLSMDTDDIGERQRVWHLEKAVPEPVLKPVPVATLSRAAGLPYETTKRYAMSLTANGLCAKLGKGFVPSASFMASQDVMTAMLVNVYALHVLIKKLEKSGMLHYLLHEDFSALEDVGL